MKSVLLGSGTASPVMADSWIFRQISLRIDRSRFVHTDFTCRSGYEDPGRSDNGQTAYLSAIRFLDGFGDCKYTNAWTTWITASSSASKSWSMS